jgi:hypothetical protein
MAFIRVTLCSYRRDRFPVVGLTVQHLSNEAIERSAMGTLQSSKLRRHLDRCLECATRVEGHRAWIAILRDGLIGRLNSIDVLALQTLQECNAVQKRRYSMRINL